MNGAAAQLLAASLATPEAVMSAAAVVTALGVLYRFLHLGELLKGTREFLQDWRGEPGRDGREPVPSFPARLARIESQTHETKGALPTLAVGLEALTDASRDTAHRVGQLGDQVATLDARVSDHRRRNERQIELLREEVNMRLAHLAVNGLRAETYRAALIELGLDIDPPNPHHPYPEEP